MQTLNTSLLVLILSRSYVDGAASSVASNTCSDTTTVEKKCSQLWMSWIQTMMFVRLCQTQKLLPLASLGLALQASSMPMYYFKMDFQTLHLSLEINPWAEHGRELVSIQVFTLTSKMASSNFWQCRFDSSLVFTENIVSLLLKCLPQRMQLQVTAVSGVLISATIWRSSPTSSSLAKRSSTLKPKSSISSGMGTETGMLLLKI